MIGGGARGMIERALIAEGGDSSRPEFKPELDRMFAGFIEHYAAHIADHSRPFPGLEAALDRLAADGYRLAVCTNKLEWLSVRLLDTLDLTSHFAAVCGQDTFGMQKPDPEVFRRTIAKPAARPTAPSWWAIPGPTFAPPAPPRCRSSPSHSAIARCRSRACGRTASSAPMASLKRRSAGSKRRPSGQAGKFLDHQGFIRQNPGMI